MPEAGPASCCAEALFPSAPGDLLQTAAGPALSEEFALAMLKRPNLPAAVIEQLARNRIALKSRKVKIALASHPSTPRHVSLPLARQFYTFDLIRVVFSPSVPADVKVAVEDLLISRLKSVTLGERQTLARRASGRVAAALLQGADQSDGQAAVARIGVSRMGGSGVLVQPIALDNPRLTEALVIDSLLRPGAGPALVATVSRHAKWSRRREIRAALLRTQHLSLARALEFSREIPVPALQELLHSSRLPAPIKDQLLREKLE
jgi:hypothetical protein